MSIGGDGDDDIDRLADELSDTNDLLRKLVEGLAGGGGGGGGGGGDDRPPMDVGDLWRIGDIKQPARSYEDYKDKRALAATSRSHTLPYFNVKDDVDERSTVDLYVETFFEGYNSLESADSGLSNDDFDEFVRKVVKRRLGGSESPLRMDMFMEIEPGAGFFGINKIERRVTSPQGEVERWTEIEVNQEKLPIGLVRFGRDHYFERSSPRANLGFEVEAQYSEFIDPRATERRLNARLAEAIYDRGDLSLSEDAKRFLPDDID